MGVFDDAAAFALYAHAGVKRKAGNTPYVLHPMETAAIAATMTDDEEVLAAAMLHDVLEDAGMTADMLTQRFGARVAALVQSETENKRRDLPPAQTWRLRKEESLRELEKCDDVAVKILWLSDKLSNMRSFYRLFRKEGKALWTRFNVKDERQHAWYYRSVARLTKELSAHSAYEEYCALLGIIFEGVKEEQ